MSNKIEFLYLNEMETVEAGITDMDRCVEVMAEAFTLHSQGDYMMAGVNGNSHGTEINFPNESPFPNMPLNTPDRRFMALTAYLGGRFDIAGEKFYGSNIANRRTGLPRSIHTIVLADKETGAPVCIMPGNLISSMRTGAVAGLGAKHLARSDAKSIGLIGAGIINKVCGLGILSQLKGIEEIKIFDVVEDAAKSLCEYFEGLGRGIKATPVASCEEAVRESDVVCIVTAGEEDPRIEKAWVKPGAFLVLPAILDVDRDFFDGMRLTIDNWKMYESWRVEWSEDPRSYHDCLELIGGDFLDYIEAGTLTADDITDIGDVVTGAAPGRTGDDETTVFAMGGVPIEDVAWAYEIYENAKAKGLGQMLTFWDEPYKL